MRLEDYDGLYDDVIKETYFDVASERIATDVGMLLFSNDDSKLKTKNDQLMHGQAGVKKVAQGQDLPDSEGGEGDSIQAVQSRFGANVVVTKDMQTFDLTNEGDPSSTMEIVESITDDGFDKIDQSFADMIIGGDSASAYQDAYGDSVVTVALDGNPFFYAAHTYNGSSETYSNLLVDSAAATNPVFSRQAVIASRTAASKHVDSHGIRRPIILDTIVCTRANEDLVKRILYSDKIAGSNNNDTNETIRSMKVVVWDRLSMNSAGTENDEMWFMIDSKNIRKALKSRWAQKPMITKEDKEIRSGNWIYPFDFYYSRSFFVPYFCWGSKPT